jgi:hypothetical protein
MLDCAPCFYLRVCSQIDERNLRKECDQHNAWKVKSRLPMPRLTKSFTRSMVLRARSGKSSSVDRGSSDLDQRRTERHL